jgi:hypothetical protein
MTTLSTPLAMSSLGSPNRGKFRRVISNVGTVISQQSESILQDPSAFKGNALILSSFILVISRVMVASLSAVKAQGTPDADYRKQESIRTGIREVGGFISSFGLLLAIATGLRAIMRKSWGIHQEEGYPFFKNLGNVFRERNNPHFVVKEADHKLDADDSFRYDRKKAAGFVKSLYGFMGKGMPTADVEKAALKRLYTWTPIVIPGMVALYVSGKLLEKFTRNHSADVVNFLSRRHGAPPPPIPPQAPGQTSDLPPEERHPAAPSSPYGPMMLPNGQGWPPVVSIAYIPQANPGDNPFGFGPQFSAKKSGSAQ